MRGREMPFPFRGWRSGVTVLALAASCGLVVGCSNGGSAGPDAGGKRVATGTMPVGTQATASPTPATLQPAMPGLNDPQMKEVALELVSSAENSTLNWRDQYGYIQNIGDGRGYTAGIMGFCSGTGDMYEVVQHYAQLRPSNVLAKYLPRLKQLNALFAGNSYEPSDASASLVGLAPNFVSDWKQAAQDPLFQQAQDWERDRLYFNPAVTLAKKDGLHELGQFIYFDTAVNVGEVSGDDFQALRTGAMKLAKPPSQGGSEQAYLRAFLRVRLDSWRNSYGEQDRVTNVQAKFLDEGKLHLQVPLYWSTYGDQYQITALPSP